MSEESIDKNENNSQQEIGEGADNSEIIADETGDVLKPGPRGMVNKNKNIELVDKDNLESNG